MSKQLLLLGVLLSSFCSGLCLPQTDLNQGLIVPTTEGLVKGTLSKNVRQFLGIPFAASTAPPHRFAPPRPPQTHFTSVFSATQFGDSCPQALTPGNVGLFEVLGISPPARQTENCLSLNVWSPSVGRVKGKGTAVLIWVYGGGFSIGSSDTLAYIGQNFVQNNDDITIVTINYRLNIFGTPAAPQLQPASSSQPKAQNFGLLDIDAAINWVHNNIEAFGGDRDRISIFGESAGAAAVDAYAFSHVGDTIVKGIICESGTVALGRGNGTFDPTPWNTIANATGCGAVSNDAQFKCMENLPIATLENALAVNNLGFGVIPDGVTIFADTATRSTNGQFLKVPLLTGTNANEGDLFIFINELILNTTFPNFEQQSEALTNATFLCPASKQSADRAKAQVPTFRYRYEAIFPDISQVPELRAFHSSEIPIVFGTYNATTTMPNPPPATANEVAFSKYVQAAWVAFARNPSAGLRGGQFQWPLYSPVTASLVELGGQSNPVGAHFVSPAAFDATCSLSA